MQTYTAALPIILTALMGYIVWLLKNQKKDRDANGKGTMLLLRVQLIEYHDRYMAKGDIPSYAYENFMEMYDAYHELGGNGMVTKMKHEIEELHLKKKEAFGPYFSLFTLGGAVEDLNITGAKYPLSHHLLKPYDSLSVSNQIQEEEVVITYGSGQLVLMETRD